jgi:hypothetical protein
MSKKQASKKSPATSSSLRTCGGGRWRPVESCVYRLFCAFSGACGRWCEEKSESSEARCAGASWHGFCPGAEGACQRVEWWVKCESVWWGMRSCAPGGLRFKAHEHYVRVQRAGTWLPWPVLPPPAWKVERDAYLAEVLGLDLTQHEGRPS